MLTVIMFVGIFALPVAAEESVTVLNENFGKVKIMGKVQTSSGYNGTIAITKPEFVNTDTLNNLKQNYQNLLTS